MFGDLDWPLNVPRGLSEIAEFLVSTWAGGEHKLLPPADENMMIAN